MFTITYSSLFPENTGSQYLIISERILDEFCICKQHTEYEAQRKGDGTEMLKAVEVYSVHFGIKCASY
jgi:hypothetical protein